MRVVAFFLLMTAIPLQAGMYHVCATAGSDAFSGHHDAPWATLQHAANKITDGDQVIVRTGTYRGFFMESKSGTAQAPITFSAEPGTIINQDNPAAHSADGIYLYDCNHIVIEGFMIMGDGGKQIPRDGIRVVGASAAQPASHVTIRDNTVDGCRYRGIFTGFVDNLVITGNRTSHSVVEHGIYVSNTCTNPVVRGNISFKNHASGIQLNGDKALGGRGTITHALIEDNIIYGNGKSGGAGINLDGVLHSTIRNNVLFGNHATGIALFRQDGGSGSSNNRIVNNTVHNAADGRWALSILNNSTGNTVANNILFTDYPHFRGSFTVSSDSLQGLTSNHNIVMNRFSNDGGATRITLAAWRKATGHDRNSIVAQPTTIFADIGQNDYRLRPGSPAINAGANPFAPPRDILGTVRPQGPAVDIGAFEYVP